jgi:hypothetical protein
MLNLPTWIWIAIALGVVAVIVLFSIDFDTTAVTN